LNIAVYSHYFTPEIGAPSARIHDMARQWLAAGHHVEVVTCFPNHPVGRLYPGYSQGRYMHEVVDGIQVHRHWTYITPNKGFVKKTLGHLSFLPSALLFSNRHITKPDVVVGTSPTFFAAMAAARTATKYRVPFIMEVRDLWPGAFVELGVLKNPLMIRLLEKWELALYRRANRVVTVTDGFRDNLVSRQVEKRKVVTIPNGAEVDFWQPAVTAEGLRSHLGLQGKFVVLYIGAHGISQALGRILESALRLQDHRDIRFLFVGEGAEKDQLVKQAQTMRLKNIQFLAPVDKETVKSLYALANICLVPLRDIPIFKTFIPSKMFEMLAMARPVLGSLSGEAAEILRASGGALVVAPEDSAAIADAILHLSQNPEEADAMGKRGRQYVLDQYSRRALAATYLQTMQQAIASFPI
jgi:glycosyltransferase involved in cell wall biosynthesis